MCAVTETKKLTILYRDSSSRLSFTGQGINVGVINGNVTFVVLANLSLKNELKTTKTLLE